MKVILLQDVVKIGKKFDIKNVSDGYGRNYLLKNKLAEIATDSVVKKFSDLKKKAEADKIASEKELESKLVSLGEEGLVIEAKANEEGSLFAGIKKEEILNLFRDKAGFSLNADSLIYEKPIKQTGESDLEIKVGDKKPFKVKLTVKALG